VLNGKPLDRDLGDALGQPVRLENDANCLAISEATDGAGAGYHVVFGAILGTGVGGGIVIERRILTGLNRIGGEWGHNPLPWATESEFPGHRCYCGKYGCIETFLSGAGLAREYFSLSQKEFPAEQIAAAEEAGEPSAVRSLAMYKRRLARSLAALDDRFHETDHGTGDLLADSSFVVDRARSGIYGRMAASGRVGDDRRGD